MITQPRAVDGTLVLADISGYTSFLRVVQVAHADDAFAGGNVPDAYALMSTLLDGIVTRLVPPFTMAKLEGDAVFAYAVEPDLVPRGAALLACVQECYDAFRARLAAAHDTWTCRCDACMRIDQLDLKFILHAGPFVIQSIGGATELVGPEVVMAHRLLKSDAAAIVGHGAYLVLTRAAADHLGVPLDGGRPMVAEYEHYEPIDTIVFELRSA
jgi:hypothetical protein